MQQQPPQQQQGPQQEPVRLRMAPEALACLEEVRLLRSMMAVAFGEMRQRWEREGGQPPGSPIPDARGRLMSTVKEEFMRR